MNSWTVQAWFDSYRALKMFYLAWLGCKSIWNELITSQSLNELITSQSWIVTNHHKLNESSSLSLAYYCYKPISNELLEVELKLELELIDSFISPNSLLFLLIIFEATQLQVVPYRICSQFGRWL